CKRRLDEAAFAHQNPYRLHRGRARTDVYDEFTPLIFLSDFRDLFLEKTKYCAVIRRISCAELTQFTTNLSVLALYRFDGLLHDSTCYVIFWLRRLVV